MEIQELKIKILVEDTTVDGGVLGESGFSARVEVLFTDSTRLELLFDTGPSSVAFCHNVRELGIDLTTLDAVVLSHGHWDHVGGLLDAVTLTKKRIPVICHPQALAPKSLKTEKGVVEVGALGFFSVDDLEKRASIITTRTPHKFADSVMTTGEIPRRTDYEQLTGILLDISTIKDGKNVPDEVEDDLSLVFHLADDSVVILTGCCHAGVVNTAARASELTGSDKIVGIVGGLHLFDASDHRLSKTVQNLKKYPLTTIAPCHCSGFLGKYALCSAFRDEFVNAGVPASIEFESDM